MSLPDATSPSGAVLLDFPDRLPAMVVKELRQGLRARGFVIPFLVLHLLVLIAVGVEYALSIGFNPSASVSAFSTQPGIFWLVVYAVVAFAMPLRMLESLQSETDGRNGEILLMGGLTRWQILRGKWLVQGVLTLLSLGSLFPYLLVRYFFGGVELIPNFLSFLSVLATASALSGCVLGASGHASLGMKFLVIAIASFYCGIVAISTETSISMVNQINGLASFALFGYFYLYALAFHALYCTIGLQMGRGHLKQFVPAHDFHPARSMLTLLITAPFMLVAGALATLLWGALIILGLILYAVARYDRSSQDWSGSRFSPQLPPPLPG